MAGPHDNLIGKRLGQYEIIDEIGRGGMATVYRARQSSINRTIAIKVLPPQFMHDPSFFERFKREVDVIAHLEHPHILPIYDYGEFDGLPFIAIRYLGGGSLSDRLAAGPVSLESLEKPLAQVADALDHAHRQGIIHRDLKPANILLDEHNNAYLTDFGIARVLNSSLTGSAIIGTPAYMSPEQAHGADVDGRSDVYSLGVVLYQMLTGREPYQATTPVAILLRHINDPMPLVRELRPEVPHAVDDVIQKATAKSPDDRFHTATGLANAYRAALHGLPLTDLSDEPPVDADAPTLVDLPPITTPDAIPAQPVVESPLANGGQTQVIPAPVRRRPLPLVLVMLLVLLVAAALVFDLPRLLTNPSQPPRPTPFAGAQIVDAGLYRLSIPDGWSMSNLPAEGANREIIWQDGSAAYVRLSLLDVGLNGDDALFNAAAAAYRAERFEMGSGYSLIDAGTAPDGSLRHSYITPAEADRPYGQTDLFFLDRAPYLVAVEIFTSADSGNSYVPMLQSILDSLQVQPTS